MTGEWNGLPGDFGGVARVVQGLLVHEFWADQYGVTLSERDRETVHLRDAESILGAVLAKDPRGLAERREPAQRVASNCRGFTVVSMAILRAHGVTARARVGFGSYFRPGFFEDHWVVEIHDGGRWRLADAQIDELQSRVLGVDFDLGDVGERFVVAGEAWRRARAGETDPSAFGLSTIGEGGLWWIAGNVMRDAAALTGIEVLPWDAWGVMPGPGEEVDGALMDELAAATRAADVPAVQLLMGDERLSVPAEVFNVLRKRREPVHENALTRAVSTS